MNIIDAEISMEVVRSVGDYVVGRTGLIMDIDINANRVRVDWKGNTRTWVAVSSVEPTIIPYEIVKKDGSYPKYIRKG